MTRRYRSRLLLFAALGAFVGGPAFAQDLRGPAPESDTSGSGPGSASGGVLGFFGRWTHLDSDFDDSGALGIGVRAGWAPAHDWALELDLSVNETTGDGLNNEVIPVHARLLKQWRVGRELRWHVGAGGTWYEFVESDGPDGPGLSFDTGLKYSAGRTTILRMDFVADTIPNPDWAGLVPAIEGWQPPDTEADWHFAIEFGLQHASPD